MNSNIKLMDFLCLILTEEPEIIGIEIDPFGWAWVVELIDGMNKAGENIDTLKLDEIVAVSNNLYSYNESKTKIRANEGHTISVDVKAAPCVPPEFLYHSTAIRFVDSIKRRGLNKQCRNHVHLSDNYTSASKFGSRHGKFTVLKINALAMYNDGHHFFLSEDNLWLTENVPNKYIEF